MKNLVRTFLSLITVSACLLSSSCTQHDDLVFLNKETAVDVDGNVYRTLTINGQVWMAENLRTTRYRNGDLIDAGPINKNDNEFFDLSKEFEPKYQWPSPVLESYSALYGRLYTWYAAMDSRNICPLGWHIPTDKEWEDLRAFLMKSDYGRYDKQGKRKAEPAVGIALASDHSFWAGPRPSTNYSSDMICTDFTEHNTTGFSAYPAGCYFGAFVNTGYLAIWRSTSSSNSWYLGYMGDYLGSGGDNIPWSIYGYRTFGMKPYDGYSIRCVKDDPNSIQDTTHNGLILLSITYPTALSSRAATIYVDITSDGDSRITERGVCWSTSPNPTASLLTKTRVGTGTGLFVNELNGLSIATNYYVRAYATNNSGTYYSNEISFSTKNSSIELTTMDAKAVSNSSATLGGSIMNKDSLEITSKGICWNTVPNPTVDLTTRTNEGTGSGNYSSKISGLNPSANYYVRAYVVSSIGIIYGNEVQFKTGLSDPVKDICGYIYHYIKIGSQTWMLENLKTSKYRDGTSIPNVQNFDKWSNLTTGAYVYYDNDSKYIATYGRLYNYYSVCDSRNIAPKGWHVATITEWKTLLDFLGGNEAAALKLKEAGRTHWNSLNDKSTNESGFTALPGGNYFSGDFMGLGSYGHWWGLTNDNSTTIFGVNIDEDKIDYRIVYKIGWIDDSKYGYSVRCVKDE